MVNWLMHVCTFVLFSIGYLGPSSPPPALPPIAENHSAQKSLAELGGIPPLMEKSYLRSSLNFVKILACEPFLES